MNETANQIGAHFANEPDHEKMLVWLDAARQELVLECDPIEHPELIPQLDAIDRALDTIERRRRQIIAAR
jgi:hypothetical protein